MKIKIVIEFDPQSHSIQVAAPHDKILSYGMLEMAKQVIANQEEKKEPMVKPVTLMPTGGRPS